MIHFFNSCSILKKSKSLLRATKSKDGAFSAEQKKSPMPRKWWKTLFCHPRKTINMLVLSMMRSKLKNSLVLNHNKNPDETNYFLMFWTKKVQKNVQNWKKAKVHCASQKAWIARFLQNRKNRQCHENFILPAKKKTKYAGLD